MTEPNYDAAFNDAVRAFGDAQSHAERLEHARAWMECLSRAVQIAESQNRLALQWCSPRFNKGADFYEMKTEDNNFTLAIANWLYRQYLNGPEKP